jgi:hypothetical protein
VLGEVNGQPWALFLGHDGRAVLVVALDIADGLVQTIRAITNPEKLRHLGLNARGPGRLLAERGLDGFVAGRPESLPSCG